MSGWRWIRSRRFTPYDAVRVALGLLLLVAAGLKAHQLASDPILGRGILNSRWFLTGVVEFELLFGLWLLANIWPKPTWTATVACFGLFSGVSLCKVLSGEASCGCFGHVQVSPSYTLMGDATAVALLASFRPRDASIDNPVSHARLVLHATGLLAVWLVVSAPVAWAIASFQPATSHDLSALGEVFDRPDGQPIVVLEPEKWIGGPCPLLPFIKPLAGEASLGTEAHPGLGERLVQGKWTLVLYSANCSECQTHLDALTSGGIAVEPSHSLALVQISGANGVDAKRLQMLSTAIHRDTRQGSLADTHRYFVETPMILLLESGKVVAVRSGRGLGSGHTFAASSGTNRHETN